MHITIQNSPSIQDDKVKTRM